MTNAIQQSVHGAGLGLRREFFNELAGLAPVNGMGSDRIDFMEVAPENWINAGGEGAKKFRAFAEQYPLVFHGLSLSIGSPAPLDFDLLKNIKALMKELNISVYSEHLSYCSDRGHLYDLMPIPFTEEAIHYVADRIKQVQDFLGHQIAMENVSYYATPGKQIEEIDFFNGVIEESDCLLHLDINNIYVNSINHGYDAEAFLKAMPMDRILYAHVAGHYRETEDLIIDTHGEDVIDPVWQLLDKAYEWFGVFPTLLERDFNIPELPTLLNEVDIIRDMQNKHAKRTVNEASPHGR